MSRAEPLQATEAAVHEKTGQPSLRSLAFEAAAKANSCIRCSGNVAHSNMLEKEKARTA